MKYLKHLCLFFFLILKMEDGYSQITIYNPIETQVSPSGEYLLAITSLDTVGFDDSVKPVDIVVYSLETRNQILKLENKIVDIAGKHLIKWGPTINPYKSLIYMGFFCLWCMFWYK